MPDSCVRDFSLEHDDRLVQQVLIQQQQIQTLMRQLADCQAEVEVCHLMVDKFVEALRHPISNISLAIAMLKRRGPMAEMADYLPIVEEECRRGCSALNEVAQLQELLPTSRAIVRKKLQALS